MLGSRGQQYNPALWKDSNFSLTLKWIVTTLEQQQHQKQENGDYNRSPSRPWWESLHVSHLLLSGQWVQPSQSEQLSSHLSHSELEYCEVAVLLPFNYAYNHTRPTLIYSTKMCWWKWKHFTWKRSIRHGKTLPSVTWQNTTLCHLKKQLSSFSLNNSLYLEEIYSKSHSIHCPISFVIISVSYLGQKWLHTPDFIWGTPSSANLKVNLTWIKAHNYIE